MKKPLDKFVILYHVSGVVLFLLYWGFFGAITNWWIGFLSAAAFMILQGFWRRHLDKIKVSEDE